MHILLSLGGKQERQTFQALCDTLEETLYALRQELREKESEISLLKEELDLYRAQVEMLSSRLRLVLNGILAEC